MPEEMDDRADQEQHEQANASRDQRAERLERSRRRVLGVRKRRTLLVALMHRPRRRFLARVPARVMSTATRTSSSDRTRLANPAGPCIDACACWMHAGTYRT